MTLPQTDKNRISYIDALKGFAIICVVLGHVGNGYMWDPGVSGLYFIMYNTLYTFHMPLFILLSGFVYRKAYFSAETGEVRKNRLFRQVINLAIIYLLWSVLLGLFKILFGAFVNNPMSWTSLLLIPIKPIQLYWYLFILIFYYMIFALVNRLKLPPAVLLIITLLISAAGSFVPSLLIFDVRRLLYYLFFFTVGITLASPWQALSAQKTAAALRVCALVLTAAAIILSVIFWDRDLFLHDRFPVNIIIGLGLSLGFYLLFKYVRFLGESRPLIYLGKHSLEIYLLHTFFLTASRAVLNRLGCTETVLHVAAGIVCGIFLPLLFSLICRKIHIYDVLFAPLRIVDRIRQKKAKAS